MHKKIAIINQERIILMIQNNVVGKFNLQLARFVPLLFILLTRGSREIRTELLLEEGIDWAEIKGHRSVMIVNWSRTKQCFNQHLSGKQIKSFLFLFYHYYPSQWSFILRSFTSFRFSRKKIYLCRTLCEISVFKGKTLKEPSTGEVHIQWIRQETKINHCTTEAFGGNREIIWFLPNTNSHNVSHATQKFRLEILITDTKGFAEINCTLLIKVYKKGLW